jgi:hypothetical protein
MALKSRSCRQARRDEDLVEHVRLDRAGLIDTPKLWRKPAAKMNSHTSGLTSAERKRSRWCRKRNTSRHTIPLKQAI